MAAVMCFACQSIQAFRISLQVLVVLNYVFPMAITADLSVENMACENIKPWLFGDQKLHEKGADTL